MKKFWLFLIFIWANYWQAMVRAETGVESEIVFVTHAIAIAIASR